MITFTSAIQKSISLYNKDPTSEGNIIKIYTAWCLAKIIKKYLLSIQYNSDEIVERNEMWKKYMKTSSTSRKNQILQSFLASDIIELYTTLSLVRDEENKVLEDLPQQYKKIPGSIGIEVYE